MISRLALAACMLGLPVLVAGCVWMNPEKALRESLIGKPEKIKKSSNKT